MNFGRNPRGSQPRQPGKLSKPCIEEMPKVDSHPTPQVSELSEASGPEPLLKKAESSGAELLVKESEASGAELLAKKSVQIFVLQFSRSEGLPLLKMAEPIVVANIEKIFASLPNRFDKDKAIVTIAPTLAYDLFNMIVEGETITIDTTIVVAMLAITIVKDVNPTIAIELLPVIVEAERQPKIDDGAPPATIVAGMIALVLEHGAASTSMRPTVLLSHLVGAILAIAHLLLKIVVRPPLAECLSDRSARSTSISPSHQLLWLDLVRSGRSDCHAS